MTALTPARTASQPLAAGSASTLTGSGRLLRRALRSERTRIGVWALSIGGLIGYFGVAIPVVYPDAAAMQTRAVLMAEPSGAFMTGPGYGLDDYTFGAMVANEMLGRLAIAVALMSIFLVVRLTRAEEESGRTDLVRAGVVGRNAPVAVALVVLVIANAAVAAVTAVALVANDLAPADSLAVAAGTAMVGLVFGALAAVTAQFSAHARTASGIAGGLLALSFVLRGIGDAAQTGGSALSWVSPIAWAQQTRAFVDLRWWPVLLGLAVAVLMATAAVALVARRDVGAGVVEARAGRADARPGLLSPFGLVLRNERATIAWWGVGVLVFAVLTGSLAQGIVDSFRDQPQLAQVFGGADEGDVLRSTVSAFLGFFAMAVAVYGVIAVNRLNQEEDEGRTGAILATSVGRIRWLFGTLLVATLGSAVLLLLIGFGLGVGVAATVGDAASVPSFTAAGLVYLPMVLCFVALAALAHGLRAGTWWVWAIVTASLLVGLYGTVLGLPQAVIDAAPLAFVPHAPSEPVTLAPLALMVIVATALTAAGVTGLRRRDLNA